MQYRNLYATDNNYTKSRSQNAIFFNTIIKRVTDYSDDSDGRVIACNWKHEASVGSNVGISYWRDVQWALLINGQSCITWQQLSVFNKPLPCDINRTVTYNTTRQLNRSALDCRHCLWWINNASSCWKEHRTKIKWVIPRPTSISPTHKTHYHKYSVDKVPCDIRKINAPQVKWIVVPCDIHSHWSSIHVNCCTLWYP